MAKRSEQPIIDRINQYAHPLTGQDQDLDPLLDMVGDRQFVLLGESTHGTHEFYRTRADITRRLIDEKGFNGVAVEADWPDAYQVNVFAKGLSESAESIDSLREFTRFPTWMWRNADVLDFIGWLREYNQRHARADVGFYGLDLYSLYASAQAVIQYLESVDPEAAERARQRYSCFEDYAEDIQSYGYAASFGVSQTCEDEAVRQLIDLRERAGAYLSRDGQVAEDAYFYAEQNARLVQNAEEYYRSMFRGRDQSWNLRDRHMTQTLGLLAEHLEKQHGAARLVVWAHNSHLGDARATEMSRRGEWNIGQLVREQHGPRALLVGFMTHHGTVTAASNWDGPAQRKTVRPGLPDSYEALMNEADPDNFFLNLRDTPDLAEPLSRERLERAIGVIYRPETERMSHYFFANLPAQFDALLHFNETRAVEPLERTPLWESEDMPQTYPHRI